MVQITPEMLAAFEGAEKEYKAEMKANPGGTFFDPISGDNIPLADIDRIEWLYNSVSYTIVDQPPMDTMQEASSWRIVLSQGGELQYDRETLNVLADKYYDEAFIPLLEFNYPT